MKWCFKWCWFVDVFDFIVGYYKWIYDQVFFDGIYIVGGCLIVVVIIDYVIVWYWCKYEIICDY